MQMTYTIEDRKAARFLVQTIEECLESSGWEYKPENSEVKQVPNGEEHPTGQKLVDYICSAWQEEDAWVSLAYDSLDENYSIVVQIPNVGDVPKETLYAYLQVNNLEPEDEKLAEQVEREARKYWIGLEPHYLDSMNIELCKDPDTPFSVGLTEFQGEDGVKEALEILTGAASEFELDTEGSQGKI